MLCWFRSTISPPLACAAAVKAARRAGYGSDFVPAWPTGNGTATTGGVAILVRRCYGFRAIEHCGLDGMMSRHHRLGAWHIGAGAKGGFLACSAYFHTGQGVSESNLEIQFQIGRLVHTVAKPFVIAADWQVAPTDIHPYWLRSI